MELLKVSDNRRFLVKEDGSSFFWLADTAWNLFHKLNRDEAEIYLNNRAENGFNVIQAVALGEHDGIQTPNAYGRIPLKKNESGDYDPCMPDLDTTKKSDYSYWEHVDYIINKAEDLGLYIALLPTWGDKFNLKWGMGPVIFDENNAFAYGKWIGERYKDNKNIIWVLGGDRPLESGKHFDIIRAMAKGIKEGDGGIHLVTFHPFGEHSSSECVNDENWLDFNMYQSGHSQLNYPNYEKITEDINMQSVKPIVDSEPRYEDHPINFNAQNGYYDDFDVRQAAYWAVFAGAFGHTYGHHSVWSMCSDVSDYFIMTWRNALDRPGATQMKYLKNLIESRTFLERIPDQSLIAKNYIGANHMRATRGNNYAFIYCPCGLKCEINMGILIGNKVDVQWYNPRNGVCLPVGCFDNIGVKTFVAPSSGRGHDWILVIDSLEK